MLNTLFTVTDDPRARRLAAAWLALAAGSLGASALFALLLVASRTPGVGGVFPGHGFFQPALVLHVNLSVLIWFLSFAGALWSAGLAPRALGLGWLGLWLAAAGAAAVVVAPFAEGGAALVNNYIPVLDNSVFLAGLGAFGAGTFATVARALWCARGRADGARSIALACAALAVLAAVLSFGWSQWALPDFLPRAAHFEALFWGPGHVLQFAHTLLMMLAWLCLGAAAGADPPGMRGTRALFIVGLLPLAAVPVIHGMFPPAGSEFRHAYTQLMSWGSWIAAAPLGLMLGWRVLRVRSTEAGARAWRAPLLLSIVLFGFGLTVGAFIRQDNAMVPAHYHGVIGAVTLAFMALACRLLPALGFPPVAPRRAALQAVLYGAGTLLMAAGLAWSGGHGVARKTSGGQQLLDGAAEVAGMAVMGAGGLVAIAGTLLFVVLVFRSMQSVAAGGLARGLRVDRRPFAAALTVGAILVAGSFVTLLPGSGPARSLMVEQLAADPRLEPARHARERQRAEVALRFEQAVVMLHARQYEHAATALHRVLQLDPSIPEAHVNMGFAMIGLKRHAVARDFFEGAIALRPMQANAYYGLAEALDELGDRPGAVGAMRSFIHLSAPGDPFRSKAEAALWEWETERWRAASKGGPEVVR